MNGLLVLKLWQLSYGGFIYFVAYLYSSYKLYYVILEMACSNLDYKDF